MLNICNFTSKFIINIIQAMESKKCSECQEPLRGRIDQKFCSDLCRNTFHNRANHENTFYVKQINIILKRNRKAIHDLIEKSGEETVKVHKNRLVDRGYNFTYQTHSYTTRKGTVYHFCYEYGFLPLEGDYYFLVKRLDEEKKASKEEEQKNI
jgi:hypothetical protein